MDKRALLVVLLFFIMVSSEFCNATYHSDVRPFYVGSNLSSKIRPYCPCGEVNSTFLRSCGVQPKVSGINVSGNWTHFGEYPWQAAIIEKYEEEFLCSGVLVSSRVVLTAGHCVQDIPVSQIKVRLGEWDILSENKNPFETYGSVDIAVAKKYLNSETWTPNEVFNLGILKLVSAVSFDEYPQIAPICLPQVMANKVNFSECIVTGWSESAIQTMSESIITSMENLPSGISPWKNPVRSEFTDNELSHCQLPFGSIQGYSEECSLGMLSGVMGHKVTVEEKPEDNTEVNIEEISIEDEQDESRIFSRILSKSAVKVLSRADCLKAMKGLNSTLPKINQLCIAAKEGSSPCLSDIGSPVICRLVDEKKNNLKDMKATGEGSLKYAVVGIITQSYSCSGCHEAGVDSHPLLATSISKNLDQICHVMSSN